jgi:hypothetical protein
MHIFIIVVVISHKTVENISENALGDSVRVWGRNSREINYSTIIASFRAILSNICVVQLLLHKIVYHGVT